MRAYIAAVALLLVLLAGPVRASQETPQDIVKWAGCKAPVVTSELHSIYESGYNGTLYIGTEPGEPADVYEIILLHEIGHCLQDQRYTEGMDWSYSADPMKFELEADMISADLACKRGQEGVRMVNLVLDRVHDKYGYNGDSDHGTLQERRDAAAMAPACKAKPHQGA